MLFHFPLTQTFFSELPWFVLHGENLIKKGFKLLLLVNLELTINFNIE